MQVTKSSNFNSVNAQTLNNKTPVNYQQARLRGQVDNKKTPAPVGRLDVSEQAIALLEQQSQRDQNKPSVKNKSSENTAKLDQPSKQNLSAISAYKNVGNLAQRENVQQLLGVNLFA